MLGRREGADYPPGADLYPFCAKVNGDRVGAGLLANRHDAVYQRHRLRCGAAIRQASSCRFMWRLSVGASLLLQVICVAMIKNQCLRLRVSDGNSPNCLR
ncbi:hypothetical protein PS639_00877 [Pseudomonas fluorescens]|nr:hypothetical protein PS639_00877 [Pseudomonas fluorescens]